VGIFLCFPAGYLNGYIFTLEDILDVNNMSFLAGFTEEPLKFLAFLFFIKPRTEFNEPMDAIVYGSVISLGFATLENIEYVYSYNEDYSSLYIASIRAISAIPLHACCGIIMGYYIALYVFKGSKKHILQALLIPIFIHALYNYLTDFGILVILSYLFLIILLAISLHNEFIVSQESKTVENEEKLL
jgi:RsiW-degrading membrane proteinase PrsW (M82 family)